MKYFKTIFCKIINLYKMRQLHALFSHYSVGSIIKRTNNEDLSLSFSLYGMRFSATTNYLSILTTYLYQD